MARLEEDSAMKASYIMTPRVITIPATASVGDAARLMLQHHISGLPVVDDAGDLIGLVTESDLLHRSEAGTERRRSRWLQFLLEPGQLAQEYVRSHSRKIADVMTRDVVTVVGDTPVDQVVRLLEGRRIKRVPVVHGRKVIGIISRANLLHVLASLPVQPPADVAADGAIRERVLAAFAGQPWMPLLPVNVIVAGGIVHLWGLITDERQRSAMRVAAENVSGARAVHDHLVQADSLFLRAS